MKLRKIIITSLFIVPVFTINSQAQESKEIETVLKQKIEYNKNNPEGKGFKIQLYNGDESTAYKIKNNYQIEFNEKAALSYESPEWKVRVGNFLTRLEADRALLEIKKKFSGAIVLATQIRL